MADIEHIRRDQAVVFAPCHVSALFVPYIEAREPEKTGSWGAGVCLGAGVVAEVQVAEAEAEAEAEASGPSVSVERLDREGPARTTEMALTKLLGDRPVQVTCKIREGAPVGQGFGVSGASALAAAFALARCLGDGRSDALRAAHIAEVRSRTGLGDVVASFLGGAVLRRAPGLPPHGAQTRLPVSGDVVAATVGEEMETSDVLRDHEIMARITEVGTACMKEVSAHPSLESIFQQGARFARETDIVSDEALDAMDACAEGGVATVAMIGNTVVAYGETEVLLDVLQGFGDPHVLPIDGGGLRTVEAMPELSESG